MVRVSVLYANSDGSHFDVDYYKHKHMKLVQERLDPFGLTGCEVDAGVPGLDGSSPPYLAIGYMFFESVDAFREGFSRVGEELVADVPNYTNVAPVIQISDYTKL